MKEGLILFFFFIKYVHNTEMRVDPLVLISNQGLVRGQRASDGDYSIFLGIPYARVDTDDPFGPAQDPLAFQEIVHNANDSSIKCPQSPVSSNDRTSIDCLRLNIYVPTEANSRNPLPVLFWIHGGDFSTGSASDYGVRNIVRHGIVVVTINYRLGPYGFMCLDVPAVPGNQGLKDQFVALRWVRNHIASFGGNPYNLTISGQDAGATSALLHLYSDKDKLYHKVIVESGTPQNEGMFVNGDADAALKLAEFLGLTTSDTDEAVQFLANTSHDLVAAAAVELNLQLKPCKERSFSGVDNFVENDPYTMTNERKVQNTPILIGYTDLERNTLPYDYFSTDPFYEKIKNNFNIDDVALLEAAETVRHFYLGDDPISTEVSLKLEEFESDFVYNHPSQRTITRLLEENAGAIYEYLFSFVGNSGADGAGHSAEIEYLFELANQNIQRTEEEQLIVDRMTLLWTNFIKYGNPTPQTTDLVPVVWRPVTTETRPCLVIDVDVRLDSRVARQRMAFWDLFYSLYGRYSKITRECSI